MINPILNTDSYKLSHYLQYPPDAEYLSCYIESRGGPFTHSVFFGLQMLLKKYLCQPITAHHIDEADEIAKLHGLPFNRDGWEYIVKKYDGQLPIEIEAVPEGSLVPVHNVLLQVVNTDPKCAWLATYVETLLLRGIWYPTSVATLSHGCYEMIKDYVDDTCESHQGIDFMLHDFGPRGASSEESAAIGGLAHLVNFRGTDNLSALMAARHYYQCEMAGFSIPAAEHSTIITWGREREKESYHNMLNQFGGRFPSFAVVSDSYDLWNAIDNIWGEKLKRDIETSGSTLVIRPDSGTPHEIVPQAIEKLMQRFGFTLNQKGFRVLPPYIRLIQGDGVNAQSIQTILEILKQQSISAENIVFGIGGELLQKINRDTQKFAMKVSAVYRQGKWIGVNKDPITDPGKRSKKGRLALVRSDEKEFETILKSDLKGRKNELELCYKNGVILRDESLDVIRSRLKEFD
ncbi:MAG: nicotinate phosphoribosyltransferase [Cellvibrio sp.]